MSTRPGIPGKQSIPASRSRSITLPKILKWWYTPVLWLAGAGTAAIGYNALNTGIETGIISLVAGLAAVWYGPQLVQKLTSRKDPK